uniref:fructose-bisphosphatase n=1 Tax=Phaeomonas parva TaxID=124430 RepID=A0A7S1TNT9_9STRA|mmetsp:Transcript_10861/g.33021  ORF Transcript_10861/g.33021 Transcript_10861/m.33021 type:complete len:272 (+) Transcript_10861:3-818(+)
MLKATVGAGGGVSCVASEEEDEPQLCAFVMDNENAAFSGDYAVVFDPLDGSANIDQGLSAGTIFGVYQVPEHAKRGDWKAALLQPGSQLLAAGYCLYGSSTTLVLTTGRGVNAFSLDEVSGDFILRHENIKMPRSGAYFSFNEGNYADWHAPVQDFVDGLKTGEGRLQRRYSGRYQGALAADVHTILLRGGIFGYPGTVSKPAGKLRLLYEAIPMSFLIEQAGGVGSDGHGRILHRMPAEIHERVPFFIGSADEVGELERCLRQPGDSDGA